MIVLPAPESSHTWRSYVDMLRVDRIPKKALTTIPPKRRALAIHGRRDCAVSATVKRSAVLGATGYVDGRLVTESLRAG